MPSAPRDDRTNRRLKRERAHALGPARYFALATVALGLAFFATVASTSIASAGEQQATPQRPQSATRVATAKTPTIVALELSRVVGGVAQVPEDAVDRIAAAAQANAQRASGLILLDISGLPLRHAFLPPASQRTIERDAYERGLSLQLAAAIKEARAQAPGIAFGILGLPFEDGPSAAESNTSYEAALQAVDVMNPLGGVLAAGTSPTAIVRDRFHSSLALAGGRPVIFRGGGGWQLATSPAAPATQRAAQTVVTGDGGSVPGALTTASGTSAVSVSTVVADWGSDASGADLNGDGIVNGFDLAVALALNPDELLAPPGGSGGEVGAGGEGVGGGSSGGDAGGDGSGGSGEGEDPLPVAPVLAIGAGFSEPAQLAAPVGEPSVPGFGARAIARWSEVPNRQITDILLIGVVAFHRNGIDRVEFSANAGPWIASSVPSLNPQNGIAEYLVSLDPASVSDGLVEVRAIVYPKTAGEPRVLAGALRQSPTQPPPLNGAHSMFVWTNAGGSFSREPVYVAMTGDDTAGTGAADSPFRTLSRATQWLSAMHGSLDGCEVRLYAGEYSADLRFPNGWQFGTADDRWFTIAAAPGVASTDVVLVHSPKNNRIRNLHLRDLVLRGSGSVGGGAVVVGEENNGNMVWIERCKALNIEGRHGAGQIVGTLTAARAYWTESDVSDIRKGPGGAALVRSCLISRIGEDALNAVGLAVNVVIDDVDRGATDWHPDVFQFFGPGATFDNYIIFGVECRNINAQGLFVKGVGLLQNMAVVNLLLDPESGINFVSQLEAPVSHLIIAHSTIVQHFVLAGGSLDSDCAFIGNAWTKISAANSLLALQAAQCYWSSNHFADAASFGALTFGTDVSVGSWTSCVVDPGAGNFVPLGGGPLPGRVAGWPIAVDLSSETRAVPAAIGALEP